MIRARESNNKEIKSFCNYKENEGSYCPLCSYYKIKYKKIMKSKIQHGGVLGSCTEKEIYKHIQINKIKKLKEILQ